MRINRLWRYIDSHKTKKTQAVKVIVDIDLLGRRPFFPDAVYIMCYKDIIAQRTENDVMLPCHTPKMRVGLHHSAQNIVTLSHYARVK